MSDGPNNKIVEDWLTANLDDKTHIMRLATRLAKHWWDNGIAEGRRLEREEIGFATSAAYESETGERKAALSDMLTWLDSRDQPPESPST